VTQQLEVKLRGPASLMEAITEDNVIITVDLVTGQIGTDKYTAQITVQSSFAGVGAMNSYTVMVTLTETD
jgi:hypothetical protein